MKEVLRDPKIENDSDFIISEKHENSIIKLLYEYPEGVPDKIICKVLQISQEELQKHYKYAILHMKRFLE